MFTHADHSALVEDDYFIGVDYCSDTLSDDYYAGVFGLFRQRFSQRFVRLVIQRGEGVVEYEYLGIFSYRPRYAEPLLLSARYVLSALRYSG